MKQPIPILTGAQITSMMRRHGVTIATLARRLTIPQTRVREVRARGVSGECCVLDWREAITGTGIFSAKEDRPDLTLQMGAKFAFHGKPGHACRVHSSLRSSGDSAYDKGLADGVESVVLALYSAGLLRRHQVQQAVRTAVDAACNRL